MGFQGGSAWAMAKSLMDGYILASPVQFKRLTNDELRELKMEVEKLLRDIRGEIPDQENNIALQKRNQKILKLSQTLSVLANYITLRQRGKA